jgi:SAM-dependent methyltransferase
MYNILILILILILINFLWVIQNSKNLKNSIALKHYENTKLLPWLEGIPNYHYHGTSKASTYELKESLEIDMKYLIKNHIKNNDTVLDIGCGFCGFNKLVNEIYNNVKVTNLTISKEAFNYCNNKGYNVKLQDFLSYNSKKKYDVIVLNESFFYLGRNLEEKYSIIKKIYDISDKIIGVFATHINDEIETWSNSGRTISPKELRYIFDKVGWRIIDIKMKPYFEEINACHDMYNIIMDNSEKIKSNMPDEIKNWLMTLYKAIIYGGNGGYRQILAAVK